MASIQGIYLAFFGRPADPLGLAYWEEQTNGGADLSVMLNALSGTEEYQARFVGMSNAEVIESIYEALFGRAPEAEGLAHFLEALENGTQTLGSIAVNILDGAQGTDLAIIENKIAAAEAFTASLDTPEEIAAYSGAAAADFGRAFINQVTEDPETVPTAEEVQEQINNDLPDYVPDEAPAPGGGGGGGGSSGGNPVTPPAAVVALNKANGATEVLAVLNEYPELFGSEEAASKFAALPAGAGRQTAIANGIKESSGYFGEFSTLKATQEVVDFFTNTESNKASFITAVRNATTQAEMIDALAIAETLSKDRQDLITKWSTSTSQSAKDRAAELVETEYTKEIHEVVESAGMKLQYIADYLLIKKGTYFGDAAIVNEIKAATETLSSISFTEASSGKTYESSIDLSLYLSPIVTDGRLTDEEFDDVVDLAGSVENALRLIWDFADNQYTADGPAGGYYIEALNSFNIDVGIRYADYLMKGGATLDDIVKFGTGRSQPMHHNILLNFDEASISDRFTASREGLDFTPQEIFDRITEAGYGDFLGEIGNEKDGRPGFGGYTTPSREPSDAWDADFFGWQA